MSKKIDYLFDIKNKIVRDEQISVSEEELKCLIVLMDKLIRKYMKKNSSLEKENSFLLHELFKIITYDNEYCHKCSLFNRDNPTSNCLSCLKTRVKYSGGIELLKYRDNTKGFF